MGDRVSEFRLFAIHPDSVDETAIPRFSSVLFGQNANRNNVSRGTTMECANPDITFSNLANLDSPHVVRVLSFNDKSILLNEQVTNTFDSWLMSKNPAAFLDTCEAQYPVHRWYHELGEDAIRFLSDTASGVVDLHDVRKNFCGTFKDIVIVPASVSTLLNEGRQLTAKLAHCVQPKDDIEFHGLVKADVLDFKRHLIKLLLLPFDGVVGPENFDEAKSAFAKAMGWDYDNRMTTFLDDLCSPWLLEDVFCYVDRAVGGGMVPCIHPLLIHYWGRIIRDGLLTMNLTGAAVTEFVRRQRFEMVLRLNCFHYLRRNRTLHWSEVY